MNHENIWKAVAKPFSLTAEFRIWSNLPKYFCSDPHHQSHNIYNAHVAGFSAIICLMTKKIAAKTKSGLLLVLFYVANQIGHRNSIRGGVQPYLIFVLFSTLANFKAWKFSTQKCANLRQNSVNHHSRAKFHICFKQCKQQIMRRMGRLTPPPWAFTVCKITHCV